MSCSVNVGAMQGFDADAAESWVSLVGDVNSVSTQVFAEKFIESMNMDHTNQEEFKLVCEITMLIFPENIYSEESGFPPGFVPTLHKKDFIRAIRNFGPIDSFFPKIAESLFPNDQLIKHWWHSLINEKNAGDYLDKAGEFVICLCDDKITVLAMGDNKTIQKYPICNTEDGFAFDPCHANSERFGSLIELVNSRMDIFRHPKESPIFEDPEEFDMRAHCYSVY